MAEEDHHIAKRQVSDTILSCKHFTLSTDETSRQKLHHREVHRTYDVTMLSVSFTKIASNDEW